MNDPTDRRSKPSNAAPAEEFESLSAEQLMDDLLGDPFPRASRESRDPFPRDPAPDAADPQKIPTSPAGPNEEEVTVIGRGLDELLARSFSDSVPPLSSSAPPPPVRPNVPGPVPRPAPSIARPAPRLDLTPTPAVSNIPASDPGTMLLENPEDLVFEPDFSPDDADESSITTSLDGDDEQTRVLRFGNEYSQPTERPPSSPDTAPPPDPETLSQLATVSPGATFEQEEPTLPPGEGRRLPPVAPPAPRLPNVQENETFSDEAQTRSRGALPSAPGISPLSVRPESVPAGVLSSTGRQLDPTAREAFVARAEWLETEAQRQSEPLKKARSLLVASELWAIAGDVSRAREVATEAATFGRALPLVGRQVRWLAALEGDHKAVASSLELESRGAGVSADARLHAAYLSAELHRLVLDDRETAKKKYDLCVRTKAEDARGHLMRLTEALAQSGAAPKLRLPEAPELAELSKTLDELNQFRTPGATSAQLPLGAFEAASRALTASDRAAAARALTTLEAIPELTRACRWLSLALLAPERTQRGQALAQAESLVAEEATESASRALAALALEQGNVAALATAFSRRESAFTPADRLVAPLLAGAHSTANEQWLGPVAEAEGHTALAFGVALAEQPEAATSLNCGPASARAALRLGRALVSTGQAEDAQVAALETALANFRDSHPDHPLVRLLGLELSLKHREVGEVAQGLADWPSGLGPRDREVASAVVFEMGGETTRAREAYERALLAAPGSEFVTRTLMQLSESSDHSELIEKLGDVLGSGPTASLFYVEAGLLRAQDDSNLEALLEKAVAADANSVLAYRLGEHLARKSGDAERLLSWLRARRAITADRLEAALDLVREALLVTEQDSSLAAELTRQALEARPSDISLFELYSRLVPGHDIDRVQWLEAAAEQATGPARARLYLEAALEAERNKQPAQAVQLARHAFEAQSSALARVVLERLAVGTEAAPTLAETLMARAKETEDAVEQRELYERLSEIDRAQGDSSAALLWQRTILERWPRYLPALRRLERAYMLSDRREDLEPIESLLAEALPAPDALAHARLAARLNLQRSNWNAARRLAELALKHEPSTAWALRILSSHARHDDDPATLVDVERRLFTLAERPSDKASLALRAAEAAMRLNRLDEAQSLIESALEQTPEHPAALAKLSEVQRTREDYAGAARTLEALAEASHVDAHRVQALYQAAVLWLDHANAPDRGRAALEQAITVDLGHEEAVARLQALYVARGDRQKLAELLALRLERTTDPEERIAIEVTRGRALSEVGDPAAARAALTAALDANPDHVEALEAFAEVCFAEGDWHGAEQALIRLARHAGDAERQAQIYQRLGELYDNNIPNPERAELAYLEVLKRRPEHEDTVDRLVSVYDRMGARDKAVQIQTQLLERATTPEAKRDRTLRLARVLAEVAREPQKAHTMLEKARKEWPHEASVLRLLVELLQRNGDNKAAQMQLDRAASDARRALGTGRFEPALFEILATVADLRGVRDAAAVAHATLAALSGQEMSVSGAGASAADAGLDDVLAPELLSPALRAFLKKTGGVLDQAYPIDLRALRATPLPPTSHSYLEHVTSVATAFGLPNIQVLVAPLPNPTCLPASCHPPTLIVAQSLLESRDDAVRYSLLVRALKVLQAQGSVLARTPPIDLWPVLAALITQFAPSFSPQAVDARKLSEAKVRIASAAPAEADNELVSLALEVSAAIGNRASQLSTALYQWGNRTALLSVGDPSAALRAVALATTGNQGPPPNGPDRIKWIVRNAEARDLAIFSVSEGYSEARRRLGLRA